MDQPSSPTERSTRSDSPRVNASIIIATYNRLWSLPDAIASCPRREDVEIIVVDDGSTDGTWDWLAEQPGIRAIRQANWGKPAAVNAGVEAACGTYVRFLDSDDLLVPDAMLEQLDFTLARQPDICVAGYDAHYEASGAIVAHPWQDCGDFLAQQLGECDSSHYSAFFFRRAFLTDVAHRAEFAFRDDRMFILECALKEPMVAIFPKATLRHRHHDRPRIQFGQGSVAIVTDWQDRRMYEKISALLDTHGLSTARRRAAIAKNMWPLALRIAGHHRREGRDAIRWLGTLDPNFGIPREGKNLLYRALGFEVAQTLVNLGRSARNGVRFAANGVRKNQS